MLAIYQFLGCPQTSECLLAPGCPFCACGFMGAQSLFWIVGIHQLLDTQRVPTGFRVPMDFRVAPEQPSAPEHPSSLTPGCLLALGWFGILAPRRGLDPHQLLGTKHLLLPITPARLAPSWLSQDFWPHFTRQPGHLPPPVARLASSSDARECQHWVPFSLASLSPQILITIAFGVGWDAGSGLCQQHRMLEGDPGIPVT